MFYNYLKIALRNIQNQKFYSSINILGLTIGIAASLMIIIYITNELSYDKFHEKSDNIYRVTLSGVLSGQEFNTATTCSPMAHALVAEYPEIKEAVRLNYWINTIAKYKDMSFTEERILLADSNFFSVFSFKLLHGDPLTALKDPNKIVISETAAKKYFGYTGPGDDSPLGKMINIGNDKRLCEVSGIAIDPPGTSHLDFDMIMSMNTWEYSKNNQWTNNSFYTYIVLDPMADPEAVSKKLVNLVDKYVGPEIEEYLGFPIQTFYDNGGKYGYGLQALTAIHLSTELIGEMGTNGSIVYLYIFSVIGLFIIFIACINFMNLTTARAANRAKEVGVRKTVGAFKTGLIQQFLIESILYSFISTLLAGLIIYISLPFFNNITEKSLDFYDFLTLKVILLTMGIALAIGLLAGSYPAFYLTAFKPVDVLKGKIRAGFKSSTIRSILVTFQYTISISLIVATLLIYKQIQMIQQHNLGFESENVIIIDNGSQLGENKEAFKNELLRFKNIISVSASNMLPPHIENNSVFRPLGANQQDQLLSNYVTDYDHIKALNLEMAAGRFFSKDFPSDSTAIIINESALKIIGWDSFENHQILSYNQDDDGKPLDVIGVVKDFNFESLKLKIRPLAIILGSGNLVAVRIAPGNIQERIDLIEEQWKKFAPGAPFDYNFLDNNLENIYSAEKRMSTLFLIFTVLAILIASLGLLGLATFTAEQRSKEIGIRKVHGASSFNLVILLSKNFTRLILLSFILATPIAYYFMSNWLEGFAYKTDLDIMYFIIGGIVALIISWLTVSYNAFKAANANPVNSLKSE